MPQQLLGACSVVLLALVLAGCDFFEFIQHAKLDTDEGIDKYRTGCIIDEETILREYVYFDQHEFHRAGRPTPTPRPIRASETEQAAQFKLLWEAGCETGRRDAVGREQATIMELQDRINVLQQHLDQLASTPTPNSG